MLFKILILLPSIFLSLIWLFSEGIHALTKTEKKQMRNEVKEMFYHAYNSYMDHAYPADELMPLTCKGRHRGTEPSRGDVDDSLGNFSLTLVDSFDTLMVLGDLEEFEHAVKLIIRDVHFDRDIVVSVFETNIRMLGGLLSGHVLADMLYRRGDALSWYRGELLDMAKDLGYRLLPAFNTSTGIPYPRVNLRYGVKQVSARTGHEKDTCTACAGTMLLEFAALSRLTDEPIFEAKAHKAMDSLWQYRHRSSNLVGTVINIHNGEWVRRESGIGAGIDSYYEYLLKAYILLGDDTYLDRFNKHYESIMRYINQGPLMVDVHMHRPTSNSKNFMDSLFAFWPGLQVLKGDLKPAVEIHEMLYQVMQRHNFLPEAFTTDFRVHWAQHPLRPEFIESTYFLYRATGDPHYLDVGKKVVENLNKHARVDCGFAAIKDVTTGKHENQADRYSEELQACVEIPDEKYRVCDISLEFFTTDSYILASVEKMDSFFLSETFKYLFLLFSEEEDLLINMDDFIFTTEAHLLPLTLSLHQASDKNISVSDSAVFYTHTVSDEDTGGDTNDDYSHTCPNSAHLYRTPDINTNYAQMFRHPLRNMVESVCPKPSGKRQSRLKASEFMAGNKDQIQLLQTMGIRILTMSDGRVQLLHTASEASTPEDAEDGMQFMQEMIELSKSQTDQTQQETRSVQILSEPHFGNLHFSAGPAQFGPDFNTIPGVSAKLVVADPLRCCNSLNNVDSVSGRIVVVERGSCMFIDKARILEASGALAAIVVDGALGSSSATSPIFAMSGDGKNDVELPMVFLFQKEGAHLLSELEKNPDLEVYLGKEPQNPDMVLKNFIVKKASEPAEEEEVTVATSLAGKMSVAIRRFDAKEDQDEPGVRLTFHDVNSRALFRIVQRPEDDKLEFQFEKHALSLITKGKMVTLIEKVVGLIQANINFGTMDLTEQSDYLFSLGKLMEASVNENSEMRLEERVRKILEEDLHLNYNDLMATIGQQGSKVKGVHSKTKSTTELLQKNINQLLDTYIQEQLNQVYNEAEEFLYNLGQGTRESQEPSESATQTTSTLDQGLDEDQSKAKGPVKQDVQQKIYSTKKIRFETRDGQVRQASWMDMTEFSLPAKENQQHFIQQEELQDAYHKMADARAGMVKPEEAKESGTKKKGTKIHKPPEWMLLQDDEIFVDAEGLIYAKFGWDEEEQVDKVQHDTDDSKYEEVKDSGEMKDHSEKATGLVDEKLLKHTVHSFENEIKFGIVEDEAERNIEDRQNEEAEDKNYMVKREDVEDEMEGKEEQTVEEIDREEDETENEGMEEQADHTDDKEEMAEDKGFELDEEEEYETEDIDTEDDVADEELDAKFLDEDLNLEKNDIDCSNQDSLDEIQLEGCETEGEDSDYELMEESMEVDEEMVQEKVLSHRKMETNGDSAATEEFPLENDHVNEQRGKSPSGGQAKDSNLLQEKMQSHQKTQNTDSKSIDPKVRSHDIKEDIDLLLKTENTKDKLTNTAELDSLLEILGDGAENSEDRGDSFIQEEHGGDRNYIESLMEVLTDLDDDKDTDDEEL